MAFIKAERIKVPIKLLLHGSAGSGKTMSALKIARGFAGGDMTKVFFIDTENGRGLDYQEQFGEYNYCTVDFPCTSEKLINTISEAELAGANTIIIDSYSDSWQYLNNRMEFGEKGVSLKEGNMTYNERQRTHEVLLNAIKYSKCNIILTAKQDYEKYIKTNIKGSVKSIQIPTKIICSNDLEYLLSVTFELRDAKFKTMKDSSNTLPKETFELSENHIGSLVQFYGGSAGNIHKSRERLMAILKNDFAKVKTSEIMMKFNTMGLDSPEMEKYLTLLETKAKEKLDAVK